MDPPDLSARDLWDEALASFDTTVEDEVPGTSGDGPGPGWLAEIIDRLERDPEESGAAFEGLSAVDEETRIAVIGALTRYGERPGVRELLRLLETRSDPYPDRGEPALPAVRAEPGRREIDRRFARIARSLVTSLDGDGRGTIVLSASDGGSRRTAAFHCDVRRGILDAVGEVEEEHASAGRLVEFGIEQAEGDCAVDAPELAVRLVEGCLKLNGATIPDPVRDWLDATIGPPRPGAGLAGIPPGPESEGLCDADLAGCADRVLDACPRWLDRSPLTSELAEEIALREAGTTPDPIRDAGAYRYLFEHHLIGRLELYGRMLLWMGWLWHASGKPELSRSAFALAAQLSDEQYAGPSHPFTVALTTRSLRAAQARLR